MLSFLRADTPRTRISAARTVIYEGGRSSITFFPTSHDTLMRVTFPGSSTTTSAPPSLILPPLHFHAQQDEHFSVITGTLLATVSGKSVTVPTGSTITVPRRALHRFDNAAASDPCTVDITLDPRNARVDERLFRNFYTYLDDCARIGSQPNIFQILLFLHCADTFLAVPGGLPRVLADRISWLMSWVGGVVVGEYLLGFRSSYEEYYSPPETKED